MEQQREIREARSRSTKPWKSIPKPDAQIRLIQLDLKQKDFESAEQNSNTCSVKNRTSNGPCSVTGLKLKDGD